MMLMSCALLDLSSELCCYWCSANVWILASGDCNVDMLGNRSVYVEACNGWPQSSEIEAICDGRRWVYWAVSHKLSCDAKPMMFQICNFFVLWTTLLEMFLVPCGHPFSLFPAHQPLRITISTSVHH